MNLRSNEAFLYRVKKVGIFFVLHIVDGDEVSKTRKLEEIAQAITEDSEILEAHEEGRIDFSAIESWIDELKEFVTDCKFAENFEVDNDDEN